MLAEPEKCLVSGLWDQLRSNSTCWVADADRIWTYPALLDTALKYASTVQSAFERQHAVIPVLVDRSVYSLAAMLGVLFAGRAFSPISVSQPETRIAHCINTLGVDDVLSGLTSIEGLDFDRFRIVPCGSDALTAPVAGALQKDDADLLYVLFTSGSTGVPKGVMCSHANILNTLLWSNDYIDWAKPCRIGMASQFSFDIAMFDFFSSLYFGHPLIILGEPRSVEKTMSQIERHDITSIFSVPAFFSQFVDDRHLARIEASALETILSGGDFFPPSHVLAWLDGAPSVRVLNVWGPTETSIVNTMHVLTEADRPRLENGQSAPVGTSHPRMPILLIDPESADPMPSGDAGEICVLGRAVSLGYLGDAALTRAHYFQYHGQPGFRTSDLGTIENGQLYISGRVGNRVKIAGHRVDLGEVENVLSGLEGIHLAAAFTANPLPEVTELWVAIQKESWVDQLDIFGIKQQLRGKLPKYMVPKKVLVMDPLPLNQNGKVDRRAVKMQALGQ